MHVLRVSQGEHDDYFNGLLEYTRRELWEHTILNTPLYSALLRKTPRHLLNPLLSHLALAA